MLGIVTLLMMTTGPKVESRSWRTDEETNYTCSVLDAVNFFSFSVPDLSAHYTALSMYTLLNALFSPLLRDHVRRLWFDGLDSSEVVDVELS